jgi:hypothetical protein
LPVLRTLWATNDVDARFTARYFVERSLASWVSAREPSDGIKLHDLQLDYIRALYPDRESLDLIHGAIRLSAHVIQEDPHQFVSQVTGRLLSYRDAPSVRVFLDKIAAGAPKPWLRPSR